MNPTTTLALDPASITAFAASLAALPKDEIRKAKSLFIRNAIADQRMMLRSGKSMLVVLGVLSIIPVFLVVFIPAYFSYKAGKENGRQKILNALEVWNAELGPESDLLRQEIARL